MRIIFMGTPDFAVGTLEALAEKGYEVVLAVTQPDRAKGRGRTVSVSPVKAAAEKLGIPVFQPEKVRKPEAVEVLREYQPDLIVVAAFGQILPETVLNLPKYGCINVHASLLPKYRGAAPIQRAILNGEDRTGITIMQMDPGLDTGDILLQSEVPITSSDTGGSLFEKLAAEGARLCVEAVAALEKGALVPVPQDEAASSYAGMLSREQGKVDFFSSAQEIERLVRAMDPWPGAYTTYKGKTLKLWKTRVAGDSPETGDDGNEPVRVEPGTVAETAEDHFTVRCGRGFLEILEVQMEGKKRMECRDFLRGVRIRPGDCLGTR